MVHGPASKGFGSCANTLDCCCCCKNTHTHTQHTEAHKNRRNGSREDGQPARSAPYRPCYIHPHRTTKVERASRNGKAIGKSDSLTSLPVGPPRLCEGFFGRRNAWAAEWRPKNASLVRKGGRSGSKGLDKKGSAFFWSGPGRSSQRLYTLSQTDGERAATKREGVFPNRNRAALGWAGPGAGPSLAVGCNIHVYLKASALPNVQPRRWIRTPCGAAVWCRAIGQAQPLRKGHTHIHWGSKWCQNGSPTVVLGDWAKSYRSVRYSLLTIPPALPKTGGKS